MSPVEKFKIEIKMATEAQDEKLKLLKTAIEDKLPDFIVHEHINPAGLSISKPNTTIDRKLFRDLKNKIQQLTAELKLKVIFSQSNKAVHLFIKNGIKESLTFKRFCSLI